MNTPRKRRHAGRMRWLLCLLAVVLMWLAGVSAWIVHVGNLDQAVPADAIIVLGAAAYDARPSPVFEQRIAHGLDLYQRGLADHLIFTGGFGGSGARFAESEVALRYALRQGISEEAILIETQSQTTRENLEQASLLMHRHGLKRAIIVSDPLHMARALRLAREYDIDALASATPTSLYRSFGTRWRFLAREVYFFHRDHLARITGRDALP